MWKKVLLGIVAFVILVVVLVLFFTKSLSDVANKQLEALRKGDTIAAYSYTSKDFQSSTSLDNFKMFINSYPSLKNNKSASWAEREINNNMGKLKGSLVAVDGGVTPAEYHFVKENKEWKIIGIQLTASGASTAPSTSATDLAQGELFQVLVNDTLNNEGNVDAAKGIVPTTAKKIFTTVYVLHAKNGLKITAELVRVENGGRIGPVEATVTQDGNIMRNFSFTNTAGNWPSGDYKINVKTSNNQMATVNFKVQLNASQTSKQPARKHRRH